jgi:hypothetical protein
LLIAARPPIGVLDPPGGQFYREIAGPETEGNSSDIPPVRSNPTHEKEHEEDDQNDAEDTDAAVTVAIAVAAESATKATKQEDDENDDKNQSQG